MLTNFPVVFLLPTGKKERKKPMKRACTHSVVSYATISEITPLLESATQWAYICHNKDPTDIHYHILLYFEQWKSFKWVREKVVSTQNTFDQEVISSIADILHYFTHESETEKAQYAEEDIIYSDITYWKKRIGEKSNQDKNEEFLNDILSEDFSLTTMAIKYGRDFIKNSSKYLDFRATIKAHEEHEAMQELLKTTAPTTQLYYIDEKGEFQPFGYQYMVDEKYL